MVVYVSLFCLYNFRFLLSLSLPSFATFFFFFSCLYFLLFPSSIFACKQSLIFHDGYFYSFLLPLPRLHKELAEKSCPILFSYYLHLTFYSWVCLHRESDTHFFNFLLYISEELDWTQTLCIDRSLSFSSFSALSKTWKDLLNFILLLTSLPQRRSRTMFHPSVGHII